jgi:hypothetical protein
MRPAAFEPARPSGQVSSPAVTAVAQTCTSSSPGPGSGTGTLWQVRLAGSGLEARMARIQRTGSVTGCVLSMIRVEPAASCQGRGLWPRSPPGAE